MLGCVQGGDVRPSEGPETLVVAEGGGASPRRAKRACEPLCGLVSSAMGIEHQQASTDPVRSAVQARACNPGRATRFSKLMKRPHLGATRMLGYALTVHDYETWEAASAVWQARLTVDENGALAWAALRALDEGSAVEVAQTAIGGAGCPLPPFKSPMDEAEDWTRIASDQELDAYALACCRAMKPERRAAFLAYLQGGPET